MSLLLSANQDLPEYLWVLSEVHPALAETCGHTSIPRILKRPYAIGSITSTPPWQLPQPTSNSIGLNSTNQEWINSTLRSYIYLGNVKSSRFFRYCPHPARPTIPQATYIWKMYRKNKPCAHTTTPPRCLPGFKLERTKSVQTNSLCAVYIWECVRINETETSSKCMNSDGTELICPPGQVCKTNGSAVKNIGGVTYRFNTGACLNACPPVPIAAGSCFGPSPSLIPGTPTRIVTCPSGYGAVEIRRWSHRGCIYALFSCSKCPQ